MSLTGDANVKDIRLAAPSGPTTPARLDGYPSFAEFIARDQDAPIYRKFERLSARRLLYLQSELHDLEGQLQELDRRDAEDIDNVEAQKAAREWKHYADEGNSRAALHRELQAQIVEKIKAYHEALLLESNVLALAKPTSRTLRAFKRWFELERLPRLWGRDQELFRDERDLVTLAPADSDSLNEFIKEYFGWFFKEKCKDPTFKSSDGLFYFPERRIRFAGALVSVLLSAILLIGAIVCLLLVAGYSMALRVGMIAIFTAMFAIVVGLLTNAKRPEIFGSTAAYAAVLVVFVSSTSTSSGNA